MIELNLKKLQEYSTKDPRQFITIINYELLRVEKIETLFADHYSIISKYLDPLRVTFLIEVPESGFAIEGDEIVGPGQIICLLGFLQSIQQSQSEPAVNFFITTKKMSDYSDLIEKIKTPLFIWCTPSAEKECGDRAIVGHYGSLSCMLRISQKVDHTKVLELISKNKNLAYFEMYSPYFELDSMQVNDDLFEISMKLKFNPANSPTELVNKYNLKFKHIFQGIPFTVDWRNECMPAYYSKESHKHIFKKIIKTYCKVEMDYCVLLEGNQPSQNLIGLGCIDEGVHNKSEVESLSRIYSAVMKTNAGL